MESLQLEETQRQHIAREHSRLQDYIELPKGIDSSLADTYRKALTGDSSAMVAIGLAYGIGAGAPKDQSQAASWYRKAAEAGSGLGMFNLAVMYENGAVITKDAGSALGWYRNAAHAGNPDAMNNLGAMYEEGEASRRTSKKRFTGIDRRHNSVLNKQGRI